MVNIMARPSLTKQKQPRPRASAAASADRYKLYELSVQSPESDVDFIDAEFRRLAGRRAHRLREDFCGTAQLCCEWLRRRRTNRATGVDQDAGVLAWAAEHNIGSMPSAERARIALVHGDVAKVRLEPHDVIAALNFSYWAFAERRSLRNYFGKVRAGLVEDGVFFLDCYGGHEAFQAGSERRRCDGYTYVWQTERYNPLDARLRCDIHFDFDDGSSLAPAFSYEWRQWSLPEIRELLGEAGFGNVVIYGQGWDEDAQQGDGQFAPVETIEADAVWICFIAAQRG